MEGESSRNSAPATVLFPTRKMFSSLNISRKVESQSDLGIEKKAAAEKNGSSICVFRSEGMRKEARCVGFLSAVSDPRHFPHKRRRGKRRQSKIAGRKQEQKDTHNIHGQTTCRKEVCRWEGILQGEYSKKRPKTELLC